MKRSKLLYLVQGALIAAIYAALTYLASIFGIAYGSIQFRFSEALTILPVLTPAAIPGLTVGCLIANIASPYPADMLFGTLATLLASVATRALRKITVRGIPVLSPLAPVIFNALIIGAEISLFMPEGITFAGFAYSALTVGAGELVVCYALGIPLMLLLKRKPIGKILQ
ncbi:MAG: QueT transporter family protein [Clostridiales bacterium]|nr:QueT transporter family protein [Clostridiales bacterium]